MTRNTAPMLSPLLPTAFDPTQTARSGAPVQMFTATTALRLARASRLAIGAGNQAGAGAADPPRTYPRTSRSNGRSKAHVATTVTPTYSASSARATASDPSPASARTPSTASTAGTVGAIARAA